MGMTEKYRQEQLRKIRAAVSCFVANRIQFTKKNYIKDAILMADKEAEFVYRMLKKGLLRSEEEAYLWI